MKAVGPGLLLVFVSTLSAPVLAGDSQIVLGSENTIFELQEGSYGDLFPAGTDADAESGVLALDVTRADGNRERWLVPGTETADSESSEILVYERDSNLVYLFWETVISGVHPALYLTSFDGAQWGQTIEFIGSPFARKESLQLVVSRAPASSSAVEDLTVLHVSWTEERAGTSVKRYAPILIVDGAYIGWTPVYDLHTFQDHDEDSSPSPVLPEIADALRAQIGKNNQSCVVGFLNPPTHRLTTLEIELLPSVLTDVADLIRAEILPFGLRVESPLELAEDMGARILELGAQFHPSVRIYMAEQTRVLIASSGVELTEEGLLTLAEQVWAEIIAVGSAIEEGGLADLRDFQVVEISALGDPDAARHLLKVTNVSDREAPEVDGEASLLLSESGRHVIVTWEDDSRVYYRESLGDGWSETSSIEIGERLDRDRIYQTLAERVRNR